MFSVNDIPVRLRDNTLRVGVEWYALCIVLRLCIGLVMVICNGWLLTGGKWLLWVIIGLMLFTGIGFLNKYYKVRPVWKSYLRYVVMSVTVVCLLGMGIWLNRADLVSIAGVLFIVDVLMGIMNRHIISCLTE